jgi:hypothetical protein
MAAAANKTLSGNGKDLKAKLHRLSTHYPGVRSLRYRRAGSGRSTIPLAALAVAAVSAVALGAVVMTRPQKPRRRADMHRLRRLEKRLQKLEDRGLRNIERVRIRGLEKHAQRGLEKLTRHFGGYR